MAHDDGLTREFDEGTPQTISVDHEGMKIVDACPKLRIQAALDSFCSLSYDDAPSYLLLKVEYGKKVLDGCGTRAMVPGEDEVSEFQQVHAVP